MKTLPLGGLLVAVALLLPGLCAAQGVAVVGELVRTSQLLPGERGEGTIVVQNVSPKVQRLRLYQTDYAFSADGKTVYGEPGQSPRSNARWFTIAPKTLEIPVGGEDVVSYAITVPNDATLTGTYWSVIMLEVLGPAAEAAAAQAQAPRAGVRTVMRYGVQMITEIGDTGARDLQYRHAGLVNVGEARVLQVDLANTGERSLIPTVWAELFDEKGVRTGRFTGGRLRLYPGCSGRFEIDLGKTVPGKYKALVVADNGDDNVFGTQYQLEIR
ncbi:MAG: hypothetical protein WCP21_17630 [Armatimonadota bacterium]